MLTSGPAEDRRLLVGPTCSPLSGMYVRRTPPVSVPTRSAPRYRCEQRRCRRYATQSACMPTSTSLCPSLPALSPWGLSVQPHVFHAPAVVDAIDHHRQPLDLRLPAGGKNIVKNDWASSVFLQFPIDLPYQPLALVLIGHRGLFVELLV